MSRSKRTKNRAFLIACPWSDDHNAQKVIVLDSFQSARNPKCHQKLPNSMKIAIQPLELRARFSRFFRFNSSKNQPNQISKTPDTNPTRLSMQNARRRRGVPALPFPPLRGGPGASHKNSRPWPVRYVQISTYSASIDPGGSIGGGPSVKFQIFDRVWPLRPKM